MRGSLRVASLNLCATLNRSIERLGPLAALLATHEPDLVLLQECRRGWLEVICRTAGLSGIRSHDILGDTLGLPPDGCAIAVRAPLQINSAAAVPGELFRARPNRGLLGDATLPGYDALPSALATRFRGRTLIADISSRAKGFAAGSFHATPGIGRYGPEPGALVGEWKLFFHAGLAVGLSKRELPFVFAIDANEPRSETVDGVRFHWDDTRPGAHKFRALLGTPQARAGPHDCSRCRSRPRAASP